MDYEVDFQEAVAGVLTLLAQRGKKPTEYSSPNGGVIEGWTVSRDGGEEVEERGRPVKDSWWYRSTTLWERKLILCTDGTFAEYNRVVFEDIETAPTVTETVRPLEMASLVGSKGKPFSEIKGKVERLPYA